MTHWDLKNKRALVTGGTKGIGLAIVKEFLGLGAEVLFTARNKEQVQQIEKELREEGFKASGLSADVSKPEDRMRLQSWISEHWGALDVLVNNAGTNIRKSTTDYLEQEYRQVMEVNLMAPFELCRQLFPLLKEGKNTSIINIASIAGMFDVRTGSPYSMSKAGLIQLSRNLAAEWAEENIRVNTVSPWFTQTPLTKGLLSDAERANPIIARTPQKRIAEAEEMAGAVAFLAMEKASYITGQNIIIDGGMSISAL
ncbi:SDR family oxidoreductase [Nafulsella turpanensis]|uniref:SDR family oxidoreductase n=1 Tax=Nafulsella turpanensis TaxID=1265690 RepID=UPI00034AC241|nr:SDR family oxidoreductase [Nafulsella turpanensis]